MLILRITIKLCVMLSFNYGRLLMYLLADLLCLTRFIFNTPHKLIFYLNVKKIFFSLIKIIVCIWVCALNLLVTEQ